MSLLSTPSTACQSPSACMTARSTAYAYFLETMFSKSERDVEEKRSQNGSLWMKFLRLGNLLLLLLPVVRVKLRLKTNSRNMRTMYLSASNRSSLQVRLRCHTVSQAAVTSTNEAAACFVAEKPSSMYCVSKTT